MEILKDSDSEMPEASVPAETAAAAERAPMAPGRAVANFAVARLDGVLINGRGELFRHGRMLACSNPPGSTVDRRNGEQLARAAARAAVAPAPVRGERLFITDRWSGNYYHWLCDTLPRLEAYLAGTGPDEAATLLLPGRVFEQPFVRQSLEAYDGVEIEAFDEAGGNLWAERLVIPAHVAPAGQQHRQLTRQVSRRLRRHFTGGERTGRAGGRRIYITRRQARMRRLANEAAVVPVLARHGFEVVTFDELALAGQIALMKETQVLAGPHGAGLTNMMFMAAGGAVVELRQPAGSPDAFAVLAQNCGHGYFRLDCRAADSAIHHHAADLVADPERLDAMLEAATGRPVSANAS
jgi:capsular polysaccharide biosynthesis protein